MHSIESPNQGTKRESLVKILPQMDLFACYPPQTCDPTLQRETLKAVLSNTRQHALSTSPSELTMPTFAAVDIGANSVRLKIATLDAHRLHVVHEDREVTRLGRTVFSTGILDPQAIAATVKVLRRFHKATQTFHADQVKVVATSALRDAQNGASFIEWVARPPDGGSKSSLDWKKVVSFTLASFRDRISLHRASCSLISAVAVAK